MSSMSKKMVNSAVALGCMLFAAPVMAHEALNEYVLDPMMVTAARYEQRDIDIPAATEIYDQEKIEKLGIDHRNQEVKGAVRVRHNEEQRRLLIAQRVQLQFIVHGKVPQLLDVEGG